MKNKITGLKKLHILLLVLGFGLITIEARSQINHEIPLGTYHMEGIFHSPEYSIPVRKRGRVIRRRSVPQKANAVLTIKRDSVEWQISHAQRDLVLEAKEIFYFQTFDEGTRTIILDTGFMFYDFLPGNVLSSHVITKENDLEESFLIRFLRNRLIEIVWHRQIRVNGEIKYRSFTWPERT